MTFKTFMIAGQYLGKGEVESSILSGSTIHPLN
jgi:hypothetical protein